MKLSEIRTYECYGAIEIENQEYIAEVEDQITIGSGERETTIKRCNNGKTFFVAEGRLSFAEDNGTSKMNRGEYELFLQALSTTDVRLTQAADLANPQQ